MKNAFLSSMRGDYQGGKLERRNFKKMSFSETYESKELSLRKTLKNTLILHKIDFQAKFNLLFSVEIKSLFRKTCFKSFSRIIILVFYLFWM